MTVLFFLIIAIMRVVQQVCNKKVSGLVNTGKLFFRYGGYYQLCSAIFALIYLCFIGFEGFNIETLLCSLITALLFIVDLFSSLQAIKGANLVVCNMFAMGGLFVPCIVGIFLFDEPMTWPKWIGLGIYIFSVYLLSNSTSEKKTFSLKTFFMLLLSFFANGLIMVVQKYFALFVTNGNIALYSTISFGTNAVLLYLFFFIFLIVGGKNDTQNNGIVKISKHMPGRLYVYGIFLALAIFSINLLVTLLAQYVPSVILFTVSSAVSLIVASIVGATVFKEKLTVKNILGCVLGIAAIIVVNIF